MLSSHLLLCSIQVQQMKDDDDDDDDDENNNKNKNKNENDDICTVNSAANCGDENIFDTHTVIFFFFLQIIIRSLDHHIIIRS